MNLIKIIFIVFSITLLACSKKNDAGSGTTPTPAPTSPSLYVLGGVYTSMGPGGYQESKVWKDGVLTDLKDIYGNVIFGKVIVNNNDLYVLNVSTSDIKLWKNGVLTNVANNPGTSYGTFFFVSGNDVYVAWTQSNTNMNRSIKLWKNGTITNITTGDYLSCGGLCVSGTDVYLLINYAESALVLGSAKAYLWKNGINTLLPGGPYKYVATSIAVSGNDVYISGVEYVYSTSIPRVLVWKNGVLTYLTDGTKEATSFYIYVSGTDVYMTGSERLTPHGNKVAKVWKNNVVISLTDGFRNASAYYILVKDGNEYITGSVESQAVILPLTPAYARLWTNGIPTNLSDGTTYAGAGQVFFY